MSFICEHFAKIEISLKLKFHQLQIFTKSPNISFANIGCSTVYCMHAYVCNIYVYTYFFIHMYTCRSIMSDVSHDNRVLSLGNRSGLRQSLTTLLDQLGRCQKALNEFLEVCTYAHAYENNI